MENKELILVKKFITNKMDKLAESNDFSDRADGIWDAYEEINHYINRLLNNYD